MTIMNDEEESDYHSLNWIIKIAVGVVTVALILSIILFLFETKFFTDIRPYDLSRIGSWGDAVGGVLNPILSFLALIGLLWTIRLQSKELSYTRKEIENSTAELKGSREANEKLVRAADQQNIENSFFQLFNFFSGMVESMQFFGTFGSASTKVVIGVRGFEGVSKDIIRGIVYKCSEISDREYYSGNPDERPIRGWENIKDEYASEYEAIKSIAIQYYYANYIQHQAELGRYYRVLYNILRFLSEKQSVLPATMVETYTKLVRASLSNYELSLIFFNCLTTNGAPMIKYAEEFALFDNLPPEIFIVVYENESGNEIGQIDLSILHKEFNKSAFGENFFLFDYDRE